VPVAVYGFTAELARRLAGSIRTDESDTGGIGGTLAGALRALRGHAAPRPSLFVLATAPGVVTASRPVAASPPACCSGAGLCGVEGSCRSHQSPPTALSSLPGNALSMAAMRATLEHVLTEEAFRQVPASFPPPDGRARSTALTRS
jgi:hypothetical protein